MSERFAYHGSRPSTVGAALAVVVVLAAVLGGCGGKKGTSTNGSGTGAQGNYAPAEPTGSGAALNETYRERCMGSLANPLKTHVIKNGSLRTMKLTSPDSSKTEREVWVYRPGGVRDSSRLPVVYVLHGLPGGPSGLWEKSDTEKNLNALFRSGAPPFVMVTLDGNGAKHPDTEWADSSDGADRVESFLLDEVIPRVEGRERRDACHRAIAGFSMGGYGAMNLAQRHPDVFGQAVSIAGYFHVDDPDDVFGGDPAVENANSPKDQVDRMKGLRIFLLDAGQENLKLVQGEAEDLAKRLADAKIPVLLDISPGQHNSLYAVTQEPAIGTFLETGWARQPNQP